MKYLCIRGLHNGVPWNNHIFSICFGSFLPYKFYSWWIGIVISTWGIRIGLTFWEAILWFPWFRAVKR